MVKDNLYFCNSQQFFNSFHVSDLKKGIYAFFLDRTFVYCIHVDHNVCIIKICQQSPYIHAYLFHDRSIYMIEITKLGKKHFLKVLMYDQIYLNHYLDTTENINTMILLFRSVNYLQLWGRSVVFCSAFT